MRLSSSLCAIGILTTLTFGCRTSGSGSSVSEATREGFQFNKVTVSIVDAEDKPIKNYPIAMDSYHWIFQLIERDPLLGIPLPGKGWTWKLKDSQQVIGVTDENGVFSLTNVKVNARGKRLTNSPAGMILGGINLVRPTCPDTGEQTGEFSIQLDTIAQKPTDAEIVSTDPSYQRLSKTCAIVLPHKVDVFKELSLSCKSQMTNEEIEAKRAELLAKCE